VSIVDSCNMSIVDSCIAGADPGFQVREAHFQTKNCAERREALNFWGFSCEKSRFYAKKSYFFPILGGWGARRVRPPLNPPLYCVHC
jgi:hypothetical protein